MQAGEPFPAPYAGLALAAWCRIVRALRAASVAKCIFGGLAGGLWLEITFAALVTGPFLRKTGAFSIPDLLSGRFPNLALRLGVIVIAAMSLLVAIAGFNSAIDALVALLACRRSAQPSPLALFCFCGRSQRLVRRRLGGSRSGIILIASLLCRNNHGPGW